MLTFKNNMALPIHRWFRFKEGFSINLFPWIYEYLPSLPTVQGNTIRVLDPFCGSGTTALTVQQQYSNRLVVDSIEINPFISLIAQSKIETYNHQADILQNRKKEILLWFKQNINKKVNIPNLSTFQKTKYFPEQTLIDLLLLRDAININCETTNEKRFFQLGWTSIIHQVSYLRKDGRALKYTPNKTISNVIDAIENQLSMMISDLSYAVYPKKESNIYLGSATKLEKAYHCRNNKPANLNNRKYSLCFYSPPYCNCMDYSEVYKLELWGLQFIQSDIQFRQLRKSTLCSHPSIKRIKNIYEMSRDERCRETWYFLQDLISKHELITESQSKFLYWLINGYFNDMYLSINQQINALISKGYIVIVVGGSKYNKLVIPTDIIIASILENLGLKVIEILVGRTYWRRLGNVDNLRESVIIAQKI